MNLKINDLRSVAKRTIREERHQATLREELFRVFGPPVMVSKNCEQVAVATNEYLDLLETSGKSLKNDIKLSALLEASRSKSSEIRKIAARLLPEKYSRNLLKDKNSSVRLAAAKRSSYALVKESLKLFPGDDQLLNVAKKLKLQEAGLPQPEEQEEYFDMYGEEPLGAAIKQKAPIDDEADSWYERLASKICSEYGGNLEGNWEEIAATRFAAGCFSVSGATIDRNRLLQAIYDRIEEREKLAMGEGSLKSLAARLLKESQHEQEVMPVIEEKKNPIKDLLESNLSAGQYVEAAEKLFQIKKSEIPPGIKKYRMGEGSYRPTYIPVNGKIPVGGMTILSEKALDRYVESWNRKQELSGEPYVLSWGPGFNSKITFNVILK